LIYEYILSYLFRCSQQRNKKLSNKMEKEKKDDTATLTAQAHGVSASYVRMVVNGKRNNESILSTFNTILETKNKLSQPHEITADSAK